MCSAASEVVGATGNRASVTFAVVPADVAAAPWWRFWRIRSELYSAIEGMERVLVASRVSAHHFFAFVASNQTFSERLVVIASQLFSDFTVLSSSLHDLWAHRPGSTTHETRNTYFNESAYETFPFPL